MVVAEDDIAYVSGINTQIGQGIEDLAAVRHHPGVDDDRAPLVLDQHHGAGHPIVGVPGSQDMQRRGRRQSLSSQMTAPLVTVAPTSACRPVTVPALCALSGCSIFMASMTTIASPSATSWPSPTGTFTIVPCIGEVTASPDAAAPAFLPAVRFGFF